MLGQEAKKIENVHNTKTYMLAICYNSILLFNIILIMSYSN